MYKKKHIKQISTKQACPKKPRMILKTNIKRTKEKEENKLRLKM